MSMDANIPPHVEDEVSALEALDTEMMRELLEYHPFPVDALPEPLNTYVTEAADAIGCDESFVALPLLSALGATLGNAVRLFVKSNYKPPSCFWTAVVGESGTAKTPAFNEATSFLNDIELEFFKEHAKQEEAYRLELESYEDKLKIWKKKRCGDRPIEPSPPILEQVMTQDATVESLAPILKENPKGLLAAPNELSLWFGSMNRYSGSTGADEAHYLCMYDGARLRVHRKQAGSKPITVPTALVAVTGNIQPGVLCSMLQKHHRESGLAARFLFAYPPRRPLLDEGNSDVRMMTRKNVDLVFRKLREIQMNGVGMNATPREIWMDPEVKETLRIYSNQFALEVHERTGDEAAAYAKLKGYAYRFALLFHCINQKYNGKDVMENVQMESAEAAINILDWFKHETDRMYAILDESAFDREYRTMAIWIRENAPAGITLRDFSRRCRAAKKNSGNAARILNGIKSLGLGEWDTSGRKKIVFRVY